jgi:hypothetical protein
MHNEKIILLMYIRQNINFTFLVRKCGTKKLNFHLFIKMKDNLDTSKFK